MTFNESVFLIEGCIEKMNKIYGSPVFDEWLIADFRRSAGKALYYAGPRGSEFEEKFASDVEELRKALFSHNYKPGDFEFSRRSGGTRYDALVALAPRIYLICNHTVAAMENTVQSEGWLKAQGPFFELINKFRSDPLVV